MSNAKYKVFDDSGLRALVSQTKANKTAAADTSAAVDGLSTDLQEMSTQLTDVLGEVETCLNELDTVKADTATVTDGLSKKADVGHTHSNYVNQNAFSKIAVGNTTVEADSPTDTLTLVAGNNVTITPDATNDKVTIAVSGTVYTHPSYTERTGVPTANQTPAFGGTFSVTQPVSDATGHITAMNSRTVKIPNTTATESAAGLMSASDKVKLNGIEDGANAYTLPSAGSSLGGVKSGGDVTISNGVITVNDDSHNHTIANVDGLQSALDGKETSGAANEALSSAKAYTDTKVADLINSAPTTLDTLGEIAAAMQANQSVVEALESAVGTKANASDLTSHTGNKNNPHGVTAAQIGAAPKTHTHAISDVSGLAAQLEELAERIGALETALSNLNVGFVKDESEM